MVIRANLSRQRRLFLLGVVAIYAGLIMANGFLQGPPVWDEADFWATSLTFSDRFIPTLEQLSSYQQLNTPLPFIIYGALERLFRQGLFAGRLLNVLLSILIVCAVGWPTVRKKQRPLRCLIGLLLCPYFLLYSGLLYTDIMACFLVLIGVMCYLRDRHLLSCLAFILAIASRQFMLAFPAAIALYEWGLMLSNTRWWPFKVSQRLSWQDYWRWMAPAIATFSIVGWIFLFKGLAPQEALIHSAAPQTYSAMLAAASSDGGSPSAVLVLNVPPVQRSLFALTPGAIFNFLGFVALYIVIPEAVLFSLSKPRVLFLRISNYLKCSWLKILAISLCLIIFAAFFPPLHSRAGILIKITDQISNEALRFAFFYALALISCIRFAKFDIISLSVWLNCLIMMKAYPWDKYVLPLAVVFWYLKGRDFSPSRFTSPTSNTAKISA